MSDANHDHRLGVYPGAAFLVDDQGRVVAANPKAEPLVLGLGNGGAGEVAALIREAIELSAPVAGTAAIDLPSSPGAIFDLSVVPFAAERQYLVVGRDVSMDRNLRAALIDSRQRYKDLVEISSDFAWEIGPNGTFVFVSPRGALGFEARDFIGRQPDEFLRSQHTAEGPLPFLSHQPVQEEEVWLRHADGSEACVVVSCLPILRENGDWAGARGVCRDVTVDRERDAALARAYHRERLLSRIVAAIRDEVEPVNMLAAAASATARALGAVGCSIHRGPDRKHLVGSAVHGTALDPVIIERALDLVNAETVIEFGAGGWRVLAANTLYRHRANGVICLWKPDDGESWGDDQQLLIADVANQLGIANEQVDNHERILKLSRTDALTGLLNRRAFFEDEVPRRIRRLEASGGWAALVYVDLDYFKLVNDVHGHQRGDEALLAVRDLLIEHTRPGDAIARLGGDEFALWLDGMTDGAIVKRTGRMIEASTQLRKFSGDPQRPLGFSIGAAMYHPASGEMLEQLLARADAAMYAAKHAGKGQVVIAPPYEDGKPS